MGKVKVEKWKWDLAKAKEGKLRRWENERAYRQWGSLLRQAAALWPTNAELRNSHCWPETHSSGLQILTPTQPLYAHPHPHMIISAVHTLANLRRDYTQSWHNATLTWSCILILQCHLHCVNCIAHTYWTHNSQWYHFFSSNSYVSTPGKHSTTAVR